MSLNRRRRESLEINCTHFRISLSVLESVPVDDDGSGLVIVDSDAPVRGSDDDNNSSGEHLTGVSANVDLEVVAAPVVTAAAAAAAANVDSECESDDEWNYVKPTTTEQQPQPKEPENFLTEEEQPEKADHGEADQVQEQQFDHREAEKSDEVIQEQHAEAQAIAESQEHCAEVSDGGRGNCDQWG